MTKPGRGIYNFIKILFFIDELKRDNKNRPREESSKKPVKRFRDVVGLTSELKSEKRDPRFDSMCGEFDEKVCMKN